MPSPARRLTLEGVSRHVREVVFAPREDATIGIELEYVTIRVGEPHVRPGLYELERIVAGAPSLPFGGRLTIEPGGQLELSTRPQTGIGATRHAAAADLYALDGAARRAGIALVALGADPHRPPQRLVRTARYQAMEEHFAAAGTDGHTMMCNTAAMQLNVGFGDPIAMARRWRLAYLLAPTLIACFANSPFEDGRPSGWRSTRQRTWQAIDARRTSPVSLRGSPADAYEQYALAADVMLIRSAEGRFAAVLPGLAFGRWLAEGHELGWPTEDDFAYHLTTLFPPVRPRGWFEIRWFDTLPTPFWHVAVAVTTALLDDEEAAERITPAVAATTSLWAAAGREGLAHDGLQVCALVCFDEALAALGRLGADDAVAAAVADYRERFVARGRSPADDRLDAYGRDGTLVPPDESPIPIEDLHVPWT